MAFLRLHISQIIITKLIFDKQWTCYERSEKRTW